MNPLACTKCARCLLMALAAMIGTLLIAGCGSGGGIIRSLGGGFSRASLNGQYVIVQTGIGINQALTSNDPFSETIVFTADGNGKLTVTVDDFDQDGSLLNPTLPVTGTYTVSSDGTGSLTINFSTPSNFAITMIDDSHFYIIEQDVFATASGFGEKQDTTAFTAAPSGTFIFKAHDLNASSRVAGFTITSGAINGTEDVLTFALLSLNMPIGSSVAMTAPNSTTGRGTFTLNDGTSFGYYVVNASKFHIMSSSGALEIGQAEAQIAPAGGFSAATLAAGTSYVFGSSGDTNLNALGIHSAGVFTTDGNGNIEPGSSSVPGAVDFVQDATVNSNLAVAAGSTYTLASNGHGTTNLVLTGGTIIEQHFWMVNGTSAYFLALHSNSAGTIEDGTFSQQTGGPFTALTSPAAFVMDGFDVAFKDRVGLFKPTATSFNWNQAANSFDPTVFDGGLPTATATNGTYQVSSNGRVTVTVNNVDNSIVFYLSSPNTGFMVQEDADIGGSFAQQASQ